MKGEGFNSSRAAPKETQNTIKRTITRKRTIMRRGGLIQQDSHQGKFKNTRKRTGARKRTIMRRGGFRLGTTPRETQEHQEKDQHKEENQYQKK